MSFPWKHSEQLLLKSFPFASFRLKKHGAPEIVLNPLFNMPRLAFIKSGEFKSGIKCIIFIQNQPDMEKVWSRNACCLIQCYFMHEKIMFNLTLGELLKTFRNLTNLHHNERTICFIFLKHRSKHGGNMPSNPNGPQKKESFFENWQWTKRLTSRADPILTITKMTTTWSIWCISLWYVVFFLFRTDVPWHFYMKQASILLY